MVFPTSVLETNPNGQTFTAFYEQWLIREERYLQELLQLTDEHDGITNSQEKELLSKELVNRVLAHYYEYFEQKARAIRENVFRMFTPPWLSSLERAYMWMGGFRAGLALKLVFNSVTDLTDDQSQMINALLMEIKEEEKELTDELQRLQEGVITSLSMVEMARNMGRPQNGAAVDMDSAFERLKVSMETLVLCADSLRMKAVRKLMDMLKPAQAVRFLAAAAQLHLNLRRFGMQRDGRIQSQ